MTRIVPDFPVPRNRLLRRFRRARPHLEGEQPERDHEHRGRAQRQRPVHADEAPPIPTVTPENARMPWKHML